MVLAGMLSQGYSTINTIIAGKFIGDSALAAIGATSPLITFLSSVFWGFGVGFAIYIARLFGAQEYKSIKNVLFTGLIVIASIVIITSLIVILFKNPIFSLFNIQADKATTQYFICYMLGFVFIQANTYGVLITNSLGIGGFPFIMSLISAFVTVGGNLFTVVVMDWGVLGLAISTVLAAFIVDMCYIMKFRQCFVEMGVANEKAAFDIRGMLSSATYALPNMAQQMILYVSGLIISPMINAIGPTATAAYTVAHKTYDINASIYQNSTKTVANYTSQACGAKKYHLLRKGVRVGVMQSMLFVLPFVLACSIFPEAIAGLFFDNDADPTSMEYAVQFMSRFLPFILINVFANLFHAYFKGIGDKAPLMISSLSGSLARIIVSLALIPSLGMTGMYIGWVAAWVADALVGLIYYIIKSKKVFE